MPDSAFARLHPVIQHHVVNTLQWPGLRPLQDAAVIPVLDGVDCLAACPDRGREDGSGRISAAQPDGGRGLGRNLGSLRLAGAEVPDPLAALSTAPRQAETERRRSADRRWAGLAEWATPTLLLRGASLPLYSRREPFDQVRLPPEPQFGPGLVVRRVGDFVGRRAEFRHARHVLRQGPGLVVHGLGGIGKTTFAAHTVAELGEHAGLIVAVSGSTTTDAVLAQVGRRLLGLARQRRLPDGDPLRDLAGELRNPKHSWADRWEWLTEEFTGTEPLLLLPSAWRNGTSSGASGRPPPALPRTAPRPTVGRAPGRVVGCARPAPTSTATAPWQPARGPAALSNPGSRWDRSHLET